MKTTAMKRGTLLMTNPATDNNLQAGAPLLLDYDIAGDGSVRAFSTTRHGGCSHGVWGEFNINAYCGDVPADIEANRQLLASELGIDAGSIVMPHQTHQTEIRQIGADFFALPPTVREMILEGVDGLMTDVQGVCIGVSTADCIPVLLYDPQHRAIAAIHAGWRGTLARIVSKAVAAMMVHFKSSPSQLRAVIGPGISPGAFEVGDEVYDAFQQAAFDMTKIARREAKWHIDLPLCNSMQLQEAGVHPENIHLSGVCTYSQADDFFSARRLGVESGRIYNGIIIPKNNP